MGFIFNCIKSRMLKVAHSRQPDFVVGGHKHPYLRRWFVIPRNPIFNIYLHQFLRDDDDRALHDHPWCSLSLLLSGEYTEHRVLNGGIHQREVYKAGQVKCMSGGYAHRIELHKGSCWTLFITGPVYRRWGFHCQEKGWVYYRDFVDHEDKGLAGKGCE